MPTLVAAVQIDSPWAQAANISAGVATKNYSTTHSTQPGDLLVVVAGSASGASGSLTTTTTGLTWTNHISDLGGGGRCGANLASVTDAAGGTRQVVWNRNNTSASDEVGGVCLQFRNHGGIGNITALTEGQTVDLTCSANSAILVLCASWSATTGARDWAVINGNEPTAQYGVDGDASTWGAAAAYWADVGAAGSKTITLDTPAGYAGDRIMAIEILAGEGGGGGQQFTTKVITNNSTGGDFSGTEDNSPWGTNPTTAYGSEVNFGCHQNGPPTDVVYGLIRFTGLTNLPRGVICSGCTLQLYQTNNFQQAGNIFLHRSLRNWTEAGATWNTFDGTNPWAGKGGTKNGVDHAGAPSAVTGIDLSNGYKTFSGAQLDADIEAFINGTQPNNGWWLTTTDFATAAALIAVSKDGTDAQRPILTVRYIVVPTKQIEQTFTTRTLLLQGNVLGPYSWLNPKAWF